MGVKGIRKKKIKSEPELTKGVEAVIDKARRDGFIKNGRVDIEGIIKNTPRIELVFDSTLEPSVSGKLTHDKKMDTWTIRVNSNHHPKRQRFTMAHEYGHFILHKDECSDFLDEEIYYRNDEKSPMEYSADKFAGELLMPSGELKKAVNVEGVNTVNALSERFEVSTMAINKRVDDLRNEQV